MSDSRILQANALLGTEPDWQPLPGAGSSNRLLLGRHDGQALVLRLNAGAGRAFGVDRRLEAAVLALIGERPWAPDVLHCAPEAGWCLMRYHGRSTDQWGEAEWRAKAAAVAAGLCTAVAGMQAIGSGPRFPYPTLLDHYRATFRHQGRHEWLARVDEAQRLFEALPDRDTALVHHDLHRGNLCLDGDRLVILDWEYAGIGCPWLDVATLAPLGMDERDILALPCAAGLDSAAVARRIAQARTFRDGLDALWYGARDPDA